MSVTIILIFSYHAVLHLDMLCSCIPGNSQCMTYMTVPPVLIFVIMLWMDKSFERVLIHMCTQGQWKLCCVLLKPPLQAAAVGYVWVTSVYLDGDWYVCCQDNHSAQQVALACHAMDITTAERKLITELKHKSWVSVFFKVIAVFISPLLQSDLIEIN